MKELGAEFDNIQDEIFYAVSDLKAPTTLTSQTWFRKVQKFYKETLSEENAKDRVKEMLERLKPMLGNQYSIIGNKNAWILKPGA